MSERIKNERVWGYYERGTFSACQVSNWETGTTVINNGEYCRAYARGNFHWGIEYEGNGLVVLVLNLYMNF